MGFLQDARLFIVAFFNGQINDYETIHLWRKDWKYVVLHSLRVEQNVLTILSHETHTLTAVEIENLQAASILHDLGKFVDRESHAPVGAEIAERWLKERINAEERISRITEIITDHSNKTGTEQDYCKAILQDADVLDEIGAMSIFMVGNWLDQSSPFYLNECYERLINFEIPYCEEKMKVLNTATAKGILQERRNFIQQFADQLANELIVDLEIEGLLRAV